MIARLFLSLAAFGMAVPQDPPAAPTGVTATTPMNGQIRLEWNAVSPAPDGYNVWRAAKSGGPYTKQNVPLIQATFHVDSAVVIGTPYFYVVRSQVATTESANSTEVTAVPTGVDVTPPNAPFITSQTRKTRVPAPTTMGTAEPGTTVRLFVGSNQIGSDVITAPNGTWSVSLSSPLGGEGEYAITARAIDSASNQSSLSNEIRITLDTTAPPAPTNLVVLATPTFMDLDWTASLAGDVAGYKVYRRTNSGSWTLLNTSGLILTTKYRDSSVSSGNTYQYRVTAVDNALDY